MANLWHPKDEVQSLYYRVFKIIQMLADLGYQAGYGKDIIGNEDRIAHIEKEWAEIKEMLRRT